MKNLFCCFLLCISLNVRAQDAHQEVISFIKVHYLNAAYNDLHIHKLQEGFHEDFTMIWESGGEIKSLDLKQWQKMIKAQIEQNKDRTYSYNIKQVQLSQNQNSAFVEIDLFQKDSFKFKDYIFLKKIENKWVVVHKYYEI